MVAVTLVDLWKSESAMAGAVAAAAAVIQAVRLMQWQGVRTFRMPIVWVLHLGYLWLVVGLALKALALVADVRFAHFYLHALTIGAAGTMILAVMTRASLGHTGRPLRVTHSTIWAYGLVTAAASAPRLHASRRAGSRTLDRRFCALSQGLCTDPAQPAGGWKARLSAAWMRVPLNERTPSR
jgi:uncharacterized protein involved in response to NO